MRFYFDLTDGHVLLRDEQGVEAASLDDALQQTGTAIEEMHNSGDLDPDRGDWRILVRNAASIVLCTIEIGRAPGTTGH